MKNITRYIVTDVVSVPVLRLASKKEAYKLATKPGWGVVDWFSATNNFQAPVCRDRNDKMQVLYCDDDCSATLYPKNGPAFVISPYEPINLKDAPTRAQTHTIIISDSCGYTFWTQNGIKIFVTYDDYGLIYTYRLAALNEGPDTGEKEIKFMNLQSEAESNKINRADIVGTLEYFRTMT